ncbi:MAG: hypothetical protein IJ874_06000 [Ruminococcus sp.]|nr:hypothetical protein [Ruminococcus sp.]
MASETVKRILAAEAEADRLTSEARARADDIISKAQQNAAIAVQKRLFDAKAEADRIRLENEKKLDGYKKQKQEEYAMQAAKLKVSCEKNMDKAVESVISGFFS